MEVQRSELMSPEFLTKNLDFSITKRAEIHEDWQDWTRRSLEARRFRADQLGGRFRVNQHLSGFEWFCVGLSGF